MIATSSSSRSGRARTSGRACNGFADEQRRVIAATVGGVRLVCVYCPNGQSVGSDKYAYKLEWLAALEKWLAEELAENLPYMIAKEMDGEVSQPYGDLELTSG